MLWVEFCLCCPSAFLLMHAVAADDASSLWVPTTHRRGCFEVWLLVSSWFILGSWKSIISTLHHSKLKKQQISLTKIRILCSMIVQNYSYLWSALILFTMIYIEGADCICSKRKREEKQVMNKLRGRIKSRFSGIRQRNKRTIIYVSTLKITWNIWMCHLLISQN